MISTCTISGRVVNYTYKNIADDTDTVRKTVDIAQYSWRKYLRYGMDTIINFVFK